MLDPRNGHLLGKIVQNHLQFGCFYVKRFDCSLVKFNELGGTDDVFYSSLFGSTTSSI